MFLQVSVILFMVGGSAHCMLGYTKLGSEAGTPMGADTHIPPGPEAGTPPGPESDTPRARGRHPPGADTPPDQRQASPQEQCMLGDMGNKRAVRILLLLFFYLKLFQVVSISIKKENGLNCKAKGKQKQRSIIKMFYLPCLLTNL